MLVTNKISHGEKSTCTSMCDHNEIKPLHIMLPKTSVSVKFIDDHTKWTYFFIEESNLLKKYINIWDKVCANIKNQFGSKSVYSKLL